MITPEEEIPNSGGFAALMPLYLSLYLVLLAIFILLTTFSTREEVRTQAVIGSLNSTFPSSPFEREGTKDPLASNSDDLTVGLALQDRLGSLFEQMVPLAEYRILRRARKMEATLSTEEVFLPDVADLRTSSRSFLMGLAENLSCGYVSEVLVITVFVRMKRDENASDSLAMTRAANFAQSMLLYGARAERIFIALEKGDENKIRLEFRVLLDKRKEEKNEGLVP